MAAVGRKYDNLKHTLCTTHTHTHAHLCLMLENENGSSSAARGSDKTAPTYDPWMISFQEADVNVLNPNISNV